MLISYKPKKHRKQPFFRHCGAFQIGHIHEAITGDYLHHTIVFSGLKKISGFCGPKAILKKLNEIGHKVHYKKHTKPHSNILQKNIEEDKISILLVGHGYDKNGKGFNPFKAIAFQHYISVRGYDKNTEEFLIYDSASIENEIKDNLRIKKPLLIKARQRGGLTKKKNIILEVETKK